MIHKRAYAKRKLAPKQWENAIKIVESKFGGMKISGKENISKFGK